MLNYAYVLPAASCMVGNLKRPLSIEGPVLELGLRNHVWYVLLGSYLTPYWHSNGTQLWYLLLGSNSIPLRVQVPNYKVSTQNHNYDS